MKRLLPLILIFTFLIQTPPLRADEGMWTFDNPPRDRWKERHRFQPSEEWLNRLRLASIKIETASAVFVSPDGLIATNQHVADGQLQKLSSPERNLTRDGFYARTREDELRCPDLEISVLVSYEDVTGRVQQAARGASSNQQANEARKAEMARIEKESADKTGLSGNVVTLYSGGEYWLYRYKKYSDVRLVFAAEQQIAFFGGDYDNFTYPRYNLDVTFFRAYEEGRPARVEHYLKWSAKGPSEGEFIVVSGQPGSTNRLLTVAQLHYHRDVMNPVQMLVWASRRDALKRYAATSPEAARRATSQIRSLENSIKRLTSQQAGLLNPRMMGKKEAEERELRKAVTAKPAIQREYGQAWEDIAAAYKELPAMAKRIALSNLTPTRAEVVGTSTSAVSRLAVIAATFARYAEQVGKPNDQRYEEFRDSRLESLKTSLLSPAPIYPDLEEAVLASWLETAQKELGPNDPFVRAALQGATPAEVARRAVSGTKLTDVETRKSLLAGGAEAIRKSADPMIELARRIEPVTAELRRWQESRIQSVETSAGQKIAQARFAIYGKTAYPDATGTLRLSYGVVSGYEEDTTLVPYRTTFYGLYDRAESFNGKPPYDLPARYIEGRQKLDLATPFNFVYTADTIGGNSGSPVVNRDLEVVGLNFDSNIQKLPNRYLYVDDAEGSRAVGVHSAAVIEALKKLYAADRLVEELIGTEK